MAAASLFVQGEGLDLSAGTLLAGFLLSTIGFSLFLYGKKQTRLPQLFAGILLMVCPFLVQNPLWMMALGALLVGGLWLAVRRGA